MSQELAHHCGIDQDEAVAARLGKYALGCPVERRGGNARKQTEFEKWGGLYSARGPSRDRPITPWRNPKSGRKEEKRQDAAGNARTSRHSDDRLSKVI